MNVLIDKMIGDKRRWRQYKARTVVMDRRRRPVATLGAVADPAPSHHFEEPGDAFAANPEPIPSRSSACTRGAP